MPERTRPAAKPPVGRANARAALAGNPSDGYGGAVLAVAIPSLEACVELREGEPSTDELTTTARWRFEREFGLRHRSEFQVGLETTIPRSVGLGGSSAIVVATLRALSALHHVSVHPVALAQLALSIEVDDLGITAGLQDRLVQTHGGLVFMDFRGSWPQVERLDLRKLPPLLIAWKEDHGEDSDIVHSDLRERWNRGDTKVRDAMSQLGGLARRARASLLGGALEGFRAAVDATYEIRAELLTLNPSHVAMVEAARGAGAAVNYTGSGGAVVCACNDQDHRDAVALVLREGGAETRPVGS